MPSCSIIHSQKCCQLYPFHLSVPCLASFLQCEHPACCAVTHPYPHTIPSFGMLPIWPDFLSAAIAVTLLGRAPQAETLFVILQAPVLPLSPAQSCPCWTTIPCLFLARPAQLPCSPLPALASCTPSPLLSRI